MSDPALSITEIHALLDLGQELVVRLQAEDGPTISGEELRDLHELVFDIVGPYAIYSDNPLRIQPSILNRLKNAHRSFDTRTARTIADKAVSYLRSRDQLSTTAKRESALPSVKAVPEEKRDPVQVKGVSWVIVNDSPPIKQKISALSELLDEILYHAKHSNLPPEQSALTEVDRAVLIAILETALNVLKSPMVEKGLMKKAANSLKKTAVAAVKKGTDAVLGKLSEEGANKLMELISDIFDA